MIFIEIQEAIKKAKEILNKNNLEDASLQTRILLASILVCRKEDLIVRGKEELSKENTKKFLEGIEKISKGYPVQYLTKSKEFMEMNFFVDRNVLVPRSDTETLVQEVIKIANNEEKKDILELCTGSGIISVSLKKYLGEVNITATDISTKALEVANKNAEELIEKNNIKFIQSDVFEKIIEKYDIIVSNPPYIKTEVMKEYNLEFEPKLALDGGEDGLEFYKIIIKEGHKHLKEKGIIALEIGYDQREEIIELVAKNRTLSKCRMYKRPKRK